MENSALNGARRRKELAEATDGRVVDLLVVGLGATGAGVALDAASRGLDVVSVDAHDLAFGTSRWSSKLVHGGLRYLASGQFRVAHECAVERGILMSRTAPHLTQSLPMVLPLLPATSTADSARMTAVLMAGNALRASSGTPRDLVPRARRLSAAETTAMVPGVRRRDLRGGLLSWEGQLEDDARLVVALARTAAAYGARVLTRLRVTDLHGDGALVRDGLTGAVLSIRARAVVNCAGVWAGGLVPGVRLRPSRGTHLVLRGGSLDGMTSAVVVPVPGRRDQGVFALPQPGGMVYVGVTDEAFDGPLPDVPVPAEGEIDFLVAVMGKVLDSPLRRDDVVGAFAGLRPLLASAGSTGDLSRRHALLSAPSGVVTVLGGKLTTYRKMAEDAVDAAVRQRGLTAGPCRTRNLAVVGAGGPHGPVIDGPPPLPFQRLVRRYGTEASRVVASACTLLHAAGSPGSRSPDPMDPSAVAAVLAPVGDCVDVTLAELLWGVSHEGALDTDDLLERRTRLALVDADRVAAEPAARRALAMCAAGSL